MSRSQSSSIYDTATSNSNQDQANSQDAYTKAQDAVGDYEGQLSKYAASNPYTSGGEYQTDQNRVLADTADATSQAAKDSLVSDAVRTGSNTAGAGAAAEKINQDNTRSMMAGQAQANEGRISNEAVYNQGVLSATAAPISAEAGLSGQEGTLANGALNTGAQAAGNNQSFWDTFGQQFAGNLGKTLGGGNASVSYKMGG